MRIVNNAIRAEFAARVRCEHCKKPCPQGCDPAHCYSRGAGWVDIRCNLVALCRVCHGNNHANHEPYLNDLLQIAADREGVLFVVAKGLVVHNDVKLLVDFFRRLDKDASPEKIQMAMQDELPLRVHGVAREELVNSGVIE